MINEEVEIIKNQMDTLDFKSTITNEIFATEGSTVDLHWQKKDPVSSKTC